MKNLFEELSNFLKTLIESENIDISNPLEGFNKSKYFNDYEIKIALESRSLLQNRTDSFGQYKLDEIVVDTSQQNQKDIVIRRISFFKEIKVKNHNYDIGMHLMPEKMTICIDDDRIREMNSFSIATTTDKHRMEGAKNYTQFANMFGGKNLSKKDTTIFESSFETNVFFHSLIENNNEELINTVISNLFQKQTIEPEIVDLLLLHDIALNHNAVQWLETVFDDFYQITSNTFKPEGIKQKISI